MPKKKAVGRGCAAHVARLYRSLLIIGQRFASHVARFCLTCGKDITHVRLNRAKIRRACGKV